MLMRSFCFPPRAKRSLSRSSGRLRLCGPSLFPGRLLSAGREHPEALQGFFGQKPGTPKPCPKATVTPCSSPGRASAGGPETCRVRGLCSVRLPRSPGTPPQAPRVATADLQERERKRTCVALQASARNRQPVPSILFHGTDGVTRTAPQLGRGYTLLSLGMSRE